MKKVYLDLAPPYLNGELHLGHVYQFCLWYVLHNSVDSLSLKRSFSKTPEILKNLPLFELVPTLGVDVLGLPISREAEKSLKAQGIVPENEAQFYSRCEEIISKNRSKVRSLFQWLGLYQLGNVKQYKTDDPFFKEKVDLLFERLKSRIVLSSRPQIYCPRCRTTLADSEVEKREQDLDSYYFTVRSSQGNMYKVMTTRPEFLTGMVALVCHPSDERYSSMVGQDFSVEVLNRTLKVPLYTSEKVHPLVGTGLVYVTRWDSSLDVELVRDLGLEGPSSLYDYDGKPLETCERYLDLMKNPAFNGLFSKGELRKGVRTLRHTERSDCNQEVLYLSRSEVFLDLDETSRRDLKGFMESIYTSPFTQNYLQRNLEVLKKWCLSRGNMYYSFEKVYEDRSFKIDTWFVSALTPLYGSLYQNEPFEVWRLQGYQILRTWGLYSVYMDYLVSTHLGGNRKITKIIAHRHVLDEESKKISKSKKNGPSLESLKNVPLPCLRMYFCQKPLEKDFSFKIKELEDISMFFRKYKNLRIKVYKFKGCRKEFPEKALEEPNFSEKNHQFKVPQVNLRFYNYLKQEAPVFNFTKMVSYVRYLVYWISSKIQKKEAVFEQDEGLDVLKIRYVLDLIQGFLRTYGYKAQESY